ncbi:hypothetical protein F8S13_01565 [Chloroflexia bacterium SDU3-3]|nr:hypothetical protein F8S13_01565 [Chloroflexia bacterium SDU3-3]
MPVVRKISMLQAEPDPDGRDPEAFVRFNRRRDRKHQGRLELIIGRELWYRLERPPRISIEQFGDKVVIIPRRDTEPGKKLHITNSSPRVWAPAKLQIAPGRYSAQIRYGRIVVGDMEDEPQPAPKPAEGEAPPPAEAGERQTYSSASAEPRDRILDYVREFYEEHKRGPTYRDIQRALAIPSRSGVWYHVQDLRGRGLVTITPQRLQTIVPVLDEEEH